LSCRAEETQLNVYGAIMLATVQARQVGLDLLGCDALALEKTLTASHLSDIEREDRLRRECQHFLTILPGKPRPRPDLCLPIVYIGTPITLVGTVMHSQYVDIAEQVASVVEDYGFQADVPGRYIKPEESLPVGVDTVDAVSHSTLAYSSAFIGVGAESASHGMGYAVRGIEDQGAPTLILNRGPTPFARVYGGSMAHRKETLYDDATEAVTAARDFLHSNQGQIRENHKHLVQTVDQLSVPLADILELLLTLDPAPFVARPMNFARAHFRLSDPIHYMHAQPWEIAALAEALGVPEQRLANLQRLTDQTPPAAPASDGQP
jgi:hypothetical protein